MINGMGCYQNTRPIVENKTSAKMLCFIEHVQCISLERRKLYIFIGNYLHKKCMAIMAMQISHFHICQWKQLILPQSTVNSTSFVLSLQKYGICMISWHVLKWLSCIYPINLKFLLSETISQAAFLLFSVNLW